MAKYEVYIAVSNGVDSDIIDTSNSKNEAFNMAYDYANKLCWNDITKDYEDYCDSMFTKYHEFHTLEYYVVEDGFIVYDMSDVMDYFSQEE